MKVWECINMHIVIYFLTVECIPTEDGGEREKTFPFSTCSRGCLKEQLDNYYKKCDKFGFKVTKIGSDPTDDITTATTR